MSKIVEVNEEGAIYLPHDLLANLLGDAAPRYAVDAQDGSLILTPLVQKPFWTTATPKERADAFRKWAMSHDSGPGLPDESLRRENMYD